LDDSPIKRYRKMPTRTKKEMVKNLKRIGDELATKQVLDFLPGAVGVKDFQEVG
jgi:hypothetical protein